MARLRSCWRPVVLAAICLSWPPSAGRAAETLRLDGVVVSHTGLSAEYAQAIGRTVAAARKVAVEQFRFDMPETITVTVTLSPGGRVRLFNDGRDRFSLTVRSEKDLRRPSASGIFHLYGLCHEVGHLAMYRPIRDHRWMTTAAAEGWAHYLGSRIVDAVFVQEGGDLWPDRYDYRADGMKRLERQLALPNPGDVAKGAGLWKELVQIVGDRGVAPIFDAWGKARIDPADPGEALGKALLASSSDRRVAAWWRKAEGTLVFKRPKSDFAAGAVARDQLAGQPRELAHDDGRQAGKKSIAGSGHAVRFEAPGDSWCVTSVRIYGSRYGQPAPPREDFHVWICDENFKAIADFPFPYAKFKRAAPEWVSLPVKPTKVPEKFIVCVAFNPTATKGVFVGRDAESSGNSLTGLPGGQGRPFAEGDWLIRVTVDRLKGSATGGPQVGTPSAVVHTDQLAGQPRELAHDDGRPAGKKSIAGSGHAVRFEAPGGSWCVTSVRVHGSRYGQPAPPQEDFHLWICDGDFKEIADYSFPYSKFKWGRPGWVTLRIRPTRVPSPFIVCAGFNPTATKGVYVGRDAESSGNSLTGLPGDQGRPFADGDWLIRVTIDQLKASAPSMRTWTDATGKFRIQAEYVGIEDGKVKLKKPDGSVIAVPLEKLSAADQRFVREKSR